MSRRSYITCAVLLGVALGAALTVGWLHNRARHMRWERDKLQITEAAARGDLLIQLIEQYRQKHGSYPESLEALSPEEKKGIPQPPPLAESGWVYTREQDTGGFQLALYLPGSIYPHGWQFYTVLVYDSYGEYPREGFGGILAERFGPWAFYVE